MMAAAMQDGEQEGRVLSPQETASFSPPTSTDPGRWDLVADLSQAYAHAWNRWGRAVAEAEAATDDGAAARWSMAARMWRAVARYAMQENANVEATKRAMGVADSVEPRARRIPWGWIAAGAAVLVVGVAAGAYALGRMGGRT